MTKKQNKQLKEKLAETQMKLEKAETSLREEIQKASDK
jgi:hypothetical protein